jgi:Mn-dependent DtxR family transcriptional regulator
MLGVQRSSVTLAARALQQTGIIEYSRGKITILDKEALLEVTCECYAAVREHHEILLGESP